MDLGSPYGIVLRKDVYPLYTEDLDHAVRLWQDYRRFGLPHGAGYASEPEDWLALISAFETEREEAERIVIDRARSKK